MSGNNPVDVNNAFGRYAESVGIASGGSVSGTADLGNRTLVGVVMPGTVTNGTVYFKVSHDGVTYGSLFDSTGSAVKAIIAAANLYPVDPNQFLGWRYVALSFPAAEEAARTFELVHRGI